MPGPSDVSKTNLVSDGSDKPAAAVESHIGPINIGRCEMAGPVYKLYMGKLAEAWYQLTEDEQNSLMAKVSAALEDAGGRTVVACNSTWSAEQCQWFGVEKFPDVEAVQKHGEDLTALDWYRYIEGTGILGTEWED
jgi:hypothetical protein